MRSIMILSIILESLLFATDKDLICGTDKSEIINGNHTLLNITYKLKVILVEFSDIKHDPKYTSTDWTNLLFSKWIYATPNMTSPDGDAVYGSMRDYYALMSDGALELTGYILNPDSNADGKPDWLTLPYPKEYYYNGSMYDFGFNAQKAAVAAGYNLSYDSTTKLCIIYAGHMYRSKGGLRPHACKTYYVMSEKYASGPPHVKENPNATFSGIGVHCHEFGHLLGWPDTYRLPQNNTSWSLMACGQYNNKAHAPAPICPEFRIQKGWITPIEIKDNVTFFSNYDLKNPEVIKISFTENPDRYFLIENRSFNSIMNFNGILFSDYNSFLPWNFINNSPDLPKQGLLVWAHNKKLSCPPDPYWSYLIQADGENNAEVKFNTAENDDNLNYHTGDSGDPFPGYSGNRIFSPWSFPTHLSSGPSPCSYPSKNVGFEILEMGADYIKIDLYCSNPQNIRPQTPWHIDTTIIANHPRITWQANCEPGFYNYEIWKNGSFYKSMSNTYFVDMSEICQQSSPRQKKYVHYSLVAKDSLGKASYPSKTVTFLVNDLQATQLPQFACSRKDYQLAPNMPNPFNVTTLIAFTLPEKSQVTIKIYNIEGRKVASHVNEILAAGIHKTVFSANSLSSGIYFFRITAKSLHSRKVFSQTRRMILMK